MTTISLIIALLALTGVSIAFWRYHSLHQTLLAEHKKIQQKAEKYRRQRSNYRRSLDEDTLETTLLRHSLEDALNHTDFLVQTLGAVNQALVAVNLRQKLAIANFACLRLYGYPTDICERSDNPFFQYGTTTAFLSNDAWRELNLGHLHWGTEEVVRHDGRRVLVERRVTPIMDNQGLAGYICLDEESTARKAAQSSPASRSDYDTLTGLLNEQTLMVRLSKQLNRLAERKQQLGQAQRMAVAKIELLNLSKITSEHGQGMVDALLIEIAQRIRSIIRADDYAGQVANNQLVVVFNRLPGKTLAVELSMRVTNTLENNYEVGAFIVNLKTRVRIIFCPDDTLDIKDLIEAQDSTMTV